MEISFPYSVVVRNHKEVFIFHYKFAGTGIYGFLTRADTREIVSESLRHYNTEDADNAARIAAIVSRIV